ncbi:MAG: permease, partial [Hyphomicrobiales bacterium]
ASDPPPQKPRSLIDGSTLFVLALVIAGAVIVFRREGIPGLTHILAEDSWLFLDILPKVLAGCLIGAFVAAVLPREFVSR